MARSVSRTSTTPSRLATELGQEQWHRQLLQRDGRYTVEQVVEAAAGLYSTAPTSYLSCVARIDGFVVDDLDRALYRDRTLVRMGALRGSGFLIPLDRVDDVASASDRSDWHRAAVDKTVGEKQRKEWSRRILDILDGRVLPAREIRAEMGVAGKDSEPLRFLLASLTDERLLVAASGARSWRDNQHGYALWDQWFPGHPARAVDAAGARERVALWYLGGHGPATVDDFSWWAGLRKALARDALDAVARCNDGGLYDVADPAEHGTAAGVRLLPIWDTALVTQKARRRMVAEDLHPFVYDASGNVTSAVVEDGRVIGVWDRGGDAGRIELKVAFFAGSGPERLVEEEAGAIARAVGAADLDVTYRVDLVDLTTASRNRFMSPLSGD